VRASHRRFGQSDPLSTLLDGATANDSHGQAGQDDFFRQQIQCEDIISACQDFDLQLLTPDTDYSLTLDIPINHVIQEQGYDNLEQSNITSYQEDFQNYFFHANIVEDEQSTCNDLKFSSLTDQDVTPMSFDLELLGILDLGNSTPAQKQKKRKAMIKQVSNKDRCKEYRKREKEKKKFLMTECKKEEEKNFRLKFELNKMEHEVFKFKKFVFKELTATKIKMSPEQLELILNY